jgi:hypothetical protein
MAGWCMAVHGPYVAIQYEWWQVVLVDIDGCCAPA